MVLSGKYFMKVTYYFLTAALFLAVILLPENSQCADSFRSINSNVLNGAYESTTDDDAKYKDCNYCHSDHHARGDVSGQLNRHEERYSQYLDTGLGYDDRSVFALETPGKCPRSRR